jgi:hypothetical protein
MTPEPEALRRAPTSALLEALVAEAGGAEVTIDWLMQRLGDRGFGMMLMLLGLVAMLPGVSAAAAIALMLPAGQMILARKRPVLPRRIGARAVGVQRLAALLRRVMPALRFLERGIRPRWPTPFEATKRVVGVAVMGLAVALLTPVPLSNVPIALSLILIAVAYIEEDGLLLAAALVLALLLLGGAAFLAWSTVSAAGDGIGLW